MLDPEYLEKFSDQLLAIIDGLTMSIVTDMSRRIAKMGRISDATKHQAHIIQNAGIVYQDAIKRVSQVSGYTNREVDRMFYEAGVKNLRNESVIYRRAGKDTVSLAQSSGMQKILNSNISKTKGQLSNLTMTTANKAQSSFINACNKATMKVQTGAFSYDKAIADAIKEVAQQGTEVFYPSGHVDKLDVAMRRAVLTGVNQASAQMNLQYAEEMGCDYVETTAHSGARPDHAIWQGKVFCISGKDAKYPNFYESTGYGTGPGLCGWNCRHNFYAFFPGISTPAYTKDMLEGYNAKKYEYNGKTHTEYEVSQMQRIQERRIRSTKRELAGFDSAIKVTDDDVLKQTLQKEFELSSVKLKQQESALKEFCKQTGRRVESARTQVHAALDGNGNIVGFNKSVAQKAVWGNKRYQKIEESSIIKVSDKQFGKKIGKHTKEYGLNPKSSLDRKKMRHTILEIVEKADEVIEGTWRGQTGSVIYYIYGEDVVVTKEDGEFVTILKGGATNARIKNSRK